MSTPIKHCNAFNKLEFESKHWKKRHLFNDVKIDPNLAKDLLTLNTRNRPVKNPLVKQYTADMTDGKWSFTGDVINIDWNGELINGQHRLLSIINSNTIQTFHIQTGLDPDSFAKMDIGRVRSNADTLSIQGYNNYGPVSGVVRYVSMYNNGMLSDYVNGGNTKMKFSNQEIAQEAAKLNKTLLEESAKIASKYYARCKFMDSIIVGPLHYIFYNIDGEKAGNFFDLLSTGDGLGSDNFPSIFYLRKKLLESQLSSMKLTHRFKFALTIKAWNLYRENRHIKQLNWSEQEPFPIPQ
jgi:hypothetical protein